MRLSRHSEYALRMLIHAALRAPSLTTVGAIAADFDLSALHLNKVAQTLAAHGYLQTVRGRSGGLRLIADPASVRLGAVVRVTEPDFQIAPCMAPGREHCPIYEPCLLKEALSAAADAFIAELDRWTLSDLLRPRTPLLIRLTSLRLTTAGNGRAVRRRR